MVQSFNRKGIILIVKPSTSMRIYAFFALNC
jgi:hypothetical protein